MSCGTPLGIWKIRQAAWTASFITLCAFQPTSIEKLNRNSNVQQSRSDFGSLDAQGSSKLIALILGLQNLQLAIGPTVGGGTTMAISTEKGGSYSPRHTKTWHRWAQYNSCRSFCTAGLYMHLRYHHGHMTVLGVNTSSCRMAWPILQRPARHGIAKNV